MQMTRGERDAVRDARGDACHRLGKAMQTAHRHWLANRALLKTAASDNHSRHQHVISTQPPWIKWETH